MEGIYIKDDGRIVIVDFDNLTASQCTASSDTFSFSSTTIGQWDPTTGTYGIEIGNDKATRTATTSALKVVSGTSNKVVVRDQSFERVGNRGFLSSGAYLQYGTSATLCSSTLVGEEHGVYNEGTTLNIVDSTLKGARVGLWVFQGKTVITGKSTFINGGSTGIYVGGAGRRCTIDIHEGTIGGLVIFEGTVNVYGGEWFSELTVGDTLNVFVKNTATKNELCDGSFFDTSQVRLSTSVGDGDPIVNYIECPQDYKVPTFSECGLGITIIESISISLFKR